MLKSSSPKRLWDHCIELEALIRSDTALAVYGLEGQVPETVMTGQTDDISNLCRYEWFQWMMYCQPKEVHPDNNMAMGRYNGPAIDVGNAITYKILLPNGNYVYRSTVRPWTPVEEANPVFLVDSEKYMSQVKEALGASCTVGYF